MGVTGDPLAAIATALLTATAASRVTVRAALDQDAPGTTLLAEARAPGVESMVDAPQVGIVEAPTYVYLREQRRPLIQNDCSLDPLPPAMLTERYDVRAQMLGPLLGVEDGALIGTISVHQVGTTRAWTEDDVTALRRAVAEIGTWLEQRRHTSPP